MSDEPPAVEGWARDLRVAQAAEARSRRAHWDQLGAEEATTASTIATLAREDHGVALHLGPAGTHRGRPTELGPDHVRLVDRDRWCYLRLSSVEVAEPAAGTAGDAAGDQDGPVPALVERTFLEVLSRLAGGTVTLVLASGARRAGRVTAVGDEVVTLEDAAPSTTGSLRPARPVYVSSSAVAAVLGVGSG